MKSIVLAGLTLFIIAFSMSPVHAVVVGGNIDITASNDLNNRQQVEPTIAVHPLNPNIIVAGAQDLRLVPAGHHRWHGYYRSTDGGQTWSVSLLPGFPGDNSPEGLASPLKRYNLLTDPVLAFDRHGNVYYAGLALDRVTFSEPAVFVARYMNDGANYAAVTLIEGFGDYPKIAVDTTGGPHDGKIYLTSTLGFQRSTDGGLTFSHPIPLPHQDSRFPPFRTGVTVAPDGDVFVLAVSTREDPQTGQFIDSIVVARFTQGGVAPVLTKTVAETISVIPFSLPDNDFRAFTLPEIAADENAAYVVWSDLGTGDSEVLLSRSIDDGNTWSAPMRVSDVSTGHQFFPTIKSLNEVVSVAWYDSRLDDGGRIENLDVFYAQSLDAAATFSPNVRVTEVSFDPNLVRRTDFPNRGQPFVGDYISIAQAASIVHVIWADNRNACNQIDPVFGCVDQDVFTATIAL